MPYFKPCHMFSLVWLLLPELHDYGNENDLGAYSSSAPIQRSLCFKSLHCKCSHRPTMLWEYLLPCTSPEFTGDSAVVGVTMWEIQPHPHLLRRTMSCSPSYRCSQDSWPVTHCPGKSKSIRVIHQTQGQSSVTQQLHPMDNHVLWGSIRSILSWLCLLSSRSACSSLTKCFWSRLVWVLAQIYPFWFPNLLSVFSRNLTGP